jgi:hypothetical protein
LLPPPCDEFTTNDPFCRATRVNPPGTSVTFFAEQNIWAQIDVARFQLTIDKTGSAGESQSRLRDIVAWIGKNTPAEFLALRRCALRSD